jgi:hypothetical protein
VLFAMWGIACHNALRCAAMQGAFGLADDVLRQGVQVRRAGADDDAVCDIVCAIVVKGCACLSVGWDGHQGRGR